MARKNDQAGFIRAAGGVVWRDRSRQELAVIARYRYGPDERSLPKGKLDKGETWEQAAIREVKEETGCLAEVGKFASLSHYWVKDRPKIVVFFDMVVVKEKSFRPSEEVRALKWMTPQKALERLTYEDERQVLRVCLNDGLADD